MKDIKIAYFNNNINNFDIYDINQFCSDHPGPECLCEKCYKYEVKKTNKKIIIEFLEEIK